MNNELKGLTVLNTRPYDASRQLSAFIQAHGGHSIDCPAICIKPCDNQWTDTLPTHCDLAFFISQNAVKYSIEALKTHFIKWPTCAAIGLKTAQALNTHQVSVPIIAEDATSESLLTHTALGKVNNKTVLIFKGSGGREHLMNTLKTRGAHVQEVNVYQRTCPKILPITCKNLWKKKGNFIILGTSVESIENIFTLFGQLAVQWLQQTPWLVLSERIKQKASASGVKCIYLSKPDALNETLMSLKEKIGLQA